MLFNSNLNHLLLDFITFINENSKQLCAYVIMLHVLKTDRVHGYMYCLVRGHAKKVQSIFFSESSSA